jgi:hypothetical protein
VGSCRRTGMVEEESRSDEGLGDDQGYPDREIGVEGI